MGSNPITSIFHWPTFSILPEPFRSRLSPTPSGWHNPAARWLRFFRCNLRSLTIGSVCKANDVWQWLAACRIQQWVRGEVDTEPVSNVVFARKRCSIYLEPKYMRRTFLYSFERPARVLGPRPNRLRREALTVCTELSKSFGRVEFRGQVTQERMEDA